ncbi:MAG: molybdenum cofactor guanylyltransferase [Cyanobacteria bacterium P01_A01_bin.123]
MSAEITLAALILAGGHSTRMGRDKALIAIDGVPMLRHMCQVALACTQSVYVVTPWRDRYRSVVPLPCQFIQEVALPRADAIAHGPLVGFAQGLAQIECEWVLLLACDLPHLTAATLQGWMASLAKVDQHTIARLPEGPKGWEPLCGFYRRRCLPNLQQFIDDGGRSFQRWLSSQTVQPLSCVDFKQLFNCNTPADLTTIQPH